MINSIEYMRAWRARHSQQVTEYAREWRARHPHYQSQRREKNRGLPKAGGKHDSEGRVYESCRIYNRKWRRLNPEKRQAHSRVFKAIKKGILMRNPCWCGETKVHAHHPNGYENALDVIWLCPLHHREIHGRTGGEQKNGISV